MNFENWISYRYLIASKGRFLTFLNVISIAGVAIGGLAFLQVKPVFACSCDYYASWYEKYDNADYIFTGKAIGKENIEENPNIILTYRYTFQVEEVFKGEMFDQIKVLASTDTMSCGYKFEEEVDYIVFLNKKMDEFWAYNCSGTQEKTPKIIATMQKVVHFKGNRVENK